MRSMAVVVLDIGTQRALELAATEDQYPVEALAPHRPDEALGEGVGLRGLYLCSNDRDPLSSKDLIERVCGLLSRSWIRNRSGDGFSASDHARLRACWVTHTALGFSVQPARCTRRLPSSMRKSTWSLWGAKTRSCRETSPIAAESTLCTLRGIGRATLWSDQLGRLHRPAASAGGALQGTIGFAHPTRAGTSGPRLSLCGNRRPSVVCRRLGRTSRGVIGLRPTA